MNQSTDPAGEPLETTSAETGAATTESTAGVDPAELREQVIDALREVYDPELPVNIYDLGLIYT